ncbi:PVC-type heme-binding CxxCH protein [Thalassoroseus pseudoceratinae]|uniref:PVC-type heme-binding CxxCH protein n=1 Tax=Thalassoroseus pseudoceratinae TaxID=2713176 RepID=UPI00197CFA29|nr:PVC-type heme-binding CxxCH protein [Thalassoroseus pseudoceratinae]
MQDARVGWLWGGVGLVLSFVGSVMADDFIPRRQSQPPGPPLSPQDAIQKMTVPDGFAVELVASEPDLVNPVSMTFDEQGRVWVTESFEYPRREPGPGRDRIKVLEDTDGDGRMDKTTIFADGLNIPSGIAVGHGGVWVANAPNLLFMQDTDGDLKADTSQVVVTGFGRYDTHELPNSLTWGPDGYLYGLNGVFNASHVKYPANSPHAKDNPNGFRFTCALFRIHPKTWEFEVFCEGTSNPWGVAFNPVGDAFISACVIDHLWHLTETGYYHRQGGPYPPHTWKLGSIVKHKHQMAAYCGIEYYDSDAYPEEYRGHLYMGNIHGGCVNVDTLEDRGATYFAKPRPDFLTANDVWFMPVDQKTGPDGSLYVLDWYDRYHCYQDANRDPKGIDRLKGRLYRVRYKNTPRPAPFNLAEETDTQLIKRLHGNNGFFASVAQRILSERLSDPQSSLANHTRKRLREVVLDEVSQKVRMRAVFALIGSHRLDPKFHLELLSHQDPEVRKWGVRAAGNLGSVAAEVDDRLADMVSTEDSPRVQLQLAIAAAKLDRLSTMPTLMRVLDRCGDDPLIPHIVWQNLLPQLQNDANLYFSLASNSNYADSRNVIGLLPRVLDVAISDKTPNLVGVSNLVGSLIRAEQFDAARLCLERIVNRVQSGEIENRELKLIRRDLQAEFEKIWQTDQAQLAFITKRMAALWGDQLARKDVRDVFTNSTASARRRTQALQTLVAVQDVELPQNLATVLKHPERNSFEFREAVLVSLGRLQSDEIASVLLSSWPKLEPVLQPKAIELLTQRPSWAKQLLAAIGEEKVSANVLNVNQVRRLMATGDEELAESIRQHWGVVRDGRDPAREQLIEEWKQKIQAGKGDPKAGRVVFHKLCGQCHQIYGEGKEVGPDITRNGRSSLEQLLSNVFDPSLVIGADYRAVTVATVDGRLVTGLLVEDSPTRIVLKIQGGKQEVIARDDVAAQKVSPVSLMPEGLEKQLKPQELLDLFEFLMLDRPPEDPEAKRLPVSTTNR